jgi:succinate dehydrogenase / fumarate reductase membrane anchor subunit
MKILRPLITRIKAQESLYKEPPLKGVKHWGWQRVSAVPLVPFSVWFLLETLRYTQADYSVVVAWLSQPRVGVCLVLFIGLIFYHGALGLQVVIEDYIPRPFWRMILISNVRVLSFVMAVLSWLFIIHITIIGNESGCLQW